MGPPPFPNRHAVRFLCGLVLLGLLPTTLVAETPAEVQAVAFGGPQSLGWEATPGAATYNVYRGVLGSEAAACHGFGIEGTTFVTELDPEPGSGFYYVVTGQSTDGTEGATGRHTLLGSCSAVMRTHVLDRLGYGWDEWTRDRIAALGLEGYIDEQLAPDGIDEHSNQALNEALAPYTPPEDIIELIARHFVRAVYSRRQLEQQVALFWANHFNTFWQKTADVMSNVFPPCESPGNPPQCDPNFPAVARFVATGFHELEVETFRHQAFHGTFRQLVETSALSPAMIIFLDTYASVAGNPNENFPRELMELYTMGVAGGQTQQDVEELSRIITGWTVCKKAIGALDPLSPCLENYWGDQGRWVAHFIPARHDTTPKTLFAGTPQEISFPACTTAADCMNELFTALDHIVDHPSTPRFICGKILQRFVTDEPDEAMVDALVEVWNDPTNPNGVGDMKAVLEATLGLGAFLDPDLTKTKIKTPFEHAAAAIRATRGRTDGVRTVLDYLVLAQHIPFYNPVPTGWAEDGNSWIGTNNYLDRQNFGVSLLTSTHPLFGAEPIELLEDNGVSTAQGHASEIVDFFADALFGGALTPAERAAAINYLATDGSGNPYPYDDTRIRQVVALLLGYPQFQEQ